MYLLYYYEANVRKTYIKHGRVQYLGSYRIIRILFTIYYLLFTIYYYYCYYDNNNNYYYYYFTITIYYYFDSDILEISKEKHRGYNQVNYESDHILILLLSHNMFIATTKPIKPSAKIG